MDMDKDICSHVIPSVGVRHEGTPEGEFITNIIVKS